MSEIILNEVPLLDDEEVEVDEFYIVDGEVIICTFNGTVADLRRDMNSIGKEAKIITNYDAVARGHNFCVRVKAFFRGLLFLDVYRGD